MKYKDKAYKKVILVGSAGSGKSYLSKLIAKYTKLPLIHLDNEYWKPGWTETPKAEWLEKQKELVSGDSWIIDGNYNGTLELRFAAADCIIFLDMNRFKCIYRVLKRHGKKRSDLPAYLEEKKDKEFLAFINWIWRFPTKGRNKILELHKQYSEKPFIVLKNRKEVNRFVKDLEKRSFEQR